MIVQFWSVYTYIYVNSFLKPEIINMSYVLVFVQLMSPKYRYVWFSSGGGLKLGLIGII